MGRERHISQGENLHYTYIGMKEGDTKRHRARCVYFDSATRWCSHFDGNCRGSAQCESYSEKYRSEESESLVKKKKKGIVIGTTIGEGIDDSVSVVNNPRRTLDDVRREIIEFTKRNNKH